jgi:hypothetical protein
LRGFVVRVNSILRACILRAHDDGQISAASDLTDNWIPSVKPPADVCPEQFCFHWVLAGEAATPPWKEYNSLEEAFAELRTFKEAGCMLGPGKCSRNKAAPGETDWYEPCEPALEKAGFPWFYFIPCAPKLGSEFREQYIRESRELWGDHDEAAE